MTTSTASAPIVLPEGLSKRISGADMSAAYRHLKRYRNAVVTDADIDVDAMLGGSFANTAAPLGDYSSDSLLIATWANFLAEAVKGGSKFPWHPEAVAKAEKLGTSEDVHWALQALDAASAVVPSSPDIYATPEGGIIMEFRFQHAHLALIIERGEALLSVFKKGVDSRTVLDLRLVDVDELKNRITNELVSCAV